MAIPHSAVPPIGGVYYVLLKKAVYGLKQAPKEWNSHFVYFLLELGFRRTFLSSLMAVELTSSSFLCILMTLTSCPPLCHVSCG